MESVRLAQEGDLELCTALVGEALESARSMRGGATLAGSANAAGVMERWTGRSAPSALFVGEIHQVVVGLAAVTAAVRAGADGPSGRIECCYVEAAARGVGVGTALMAAVVDWCAAQGCGDIDALALPGDRSSKQRLEAAGFVARLLTLNRRLD
jgi:GNAT superfamily N-acetyltransferase